jgi:hypothetical protein
VIFSLRRLGGVILPLLLLCASPALRSAHGSALPEAALLRLLRAELGPEIASRLLPRGTSVLEGEMGIRLTRLLEESCGEVSDRALQGLSAAARVELARSAQEILLAGRLELLPASRNASYVDSGRKFLADRWRIAPMSAPKSADPASANRFLTTLSEPVVLQGPPESRALRRSSILLEGGGNHEARLNAMGTILRLSPAEAGGSGSRATYDGVEYVEFPNSTLLQSVDPATGNARSFLLSRGVRSYVTDIELASGKISPQGYVSDVLLFEIVNGKAIYRSRLLSSMERARFFFEDPRISVLHFEDGSRKVFLSGTDYSPHLRGSSSPDVMNRYLELKFDDRGLPLPIETDAGGIPRFSDLSPFPRSRDGGDGVISVDAKNATIAFNENDQVVVRTRLRPDFKLPEIRALAGGDHWNYGEQVFVFESYDDFVHYDWNHCLEDLFARDAATGARVRPVAAKVILRDTQLRELFRDARVLPAKGKGGGPGTPPVRVVRRGANLFVSDGKNAQEFLAGRVPRDFSLRDGEVSYLSFDHEIRYFSDVREGQAFLKRHYSLSVKKFDPSLTRIDAYYADALQPRTAHELGYNSGIADLQHVYPMGREVVVGADGLARVRVSLGVSDAHTEMVDVDIIKLLLEMAPGSARWRAGQVYRP